MKKRIFSALLALCMVFALLPGAALAAGVTWNSSNYAISDGEATIKSFPDVHFEGDVEVPNSLGGCPVTKIGPNAFDSCAGITTINLPETVREIGKEAFRACAGLEAVYLPPAVKAIGADAFAGCPTDLILFGELDSFAEQYALANNIMFLASSMPFTDVSENAWYFPYVYSVYSTHLMRGMSPTTFEPNTKLSRAMLATILYRLEGEQDVTGLANPFADVPEGQWYSDAIKWCAAVGIVNGVTPTSFAPNANITREQVVTMFSRYCKEIYHCNVSSAYPMNVFTDTGDISGYAVAPFCWAVENHIIDGMTPTTLVPQGTATRAQVATMMVRVVHYLDDEGYVI